MILQTGQRRRMLPFPMLVSVDLFGMTGNEHWNVIAIYPETDFNGLMTGLQIDGLAPTPVQRATVKLFGRGSRQNCPHSDRTGD